jgi:peptidoglycan/xylan/chitin deacetylase (PgdA/CDA1 family)
LAAEPAWWPYAVAALAANHGALAIGVMLPRSRMLGPNMRTLPSPAASRGEIALTFDDGPDPEITPRVLDALDRHGAKATFFCIGRRAAAHASLVRDIARRGHCVENHSDKHADGFAAYGPRRLHRDIAAAQDTLAGITGRAPAYFRAPMGFRSPFLDPVLAHLGLVCVSWTRRGFDAVDVDATRICARLTPAVRAGSILLLHDGRRARAQPSAVLVVLSALLERIRSAGLEPVTVETACHA